MEVLQFTLLSFNINGKEEPLLLRAPGYVARLSDAAQKIGKKETIIS